MLNTAKSLQYQETEWKSEIFSDNLRLFNSIYNDIETAKHYIYIETYKFGKDTFGLKFKDILTQKQKEGVTVKLLIDAWGSSINEAFFAELIKAGGEVRLFKKLIWGFQFFNKNHKRDHRKIVLIDDEISYIGSANYTDYSINWRELNLRITGNIAFGFKKVFFENWSIYNNRFYDNLPQQKIRKYLARFDRPITYQNFEIIRDIPSTIIQPLKRKYADLINTAQKQVIIETPYFLPSKSLRRALIVAARKGVDIKVIIPKHSDVTAVDLIRNRYLGMMYANGIKVYLYTPRNLHAKLLLVDDQYFALGSPNFDYRSFRFQYEIALIGKDEHIIKDLHKHSLETLKECEEFNFDAYQKRPMIDKILELILVPFRHLF